MGKLCGQFEHPGNLCTNTEVGFQQTQRVCIHRVGGVLRIQDLLWFAKLLSLGCSRSDCRCNYGQKSFMLTH